MVEPFLGTWKLDSSENFDKFLKELGMSSHVRSLALSVKPTVNISMKGEIVNIKTENSFKDTESSFKLGEEFDETTGDNRKMKSTITMKDGSMVHAQKWLEKEITIKRQIVDGKMEVNYAMNNIVSSRTYKKR